jgi:GT2 family glycosyltransferase
MSSLSDLTILIVTYRTDEKILKDCINSIDSNIKIRIIENSSEFKFKEKFEKLYPNITIHCTGKNLGMGSGNNFGIQFVNTRYIFILNPDTICNKDFFTKVENYLNKDIEFSILGATFKNEEHYQSAGYFEKNSTVKNEFDESGLKKVDWVIGCSMIIDLKKFTTKKIFDENFFLYFEEMDLCKQIKNNEGNVYVSKDLIINHLGNKSSSQADPVLARDTEILRNWHYMWSTFYFHKKNYGYLSAFNKTYGKIARSLVKVIFFTITFNKFQKLVYLSRLLGLFSSMIGKKSSYRVNSLFQ